MRVEIPHGPLIGTCLEKRKSFRAFCYVAFLDTWVIYVTFGNLWLTSVCRIDHQCSHWDW